jgi:hypothetical protein
MLRRIYSGLDSADKRHDGFQFAPINSEVDLVLLVDSRSTATGPDNEFIPAKVIHHWISGTNERNECVDHAGGVVLAPAVQDGDAFPCGEFGSDNSGVYHSFKLTNDDGLLRVIVPNAA